MKGVQYFPERVNELISDGKFDMTMHLSIHDILLANVINEGILLLNL